MPNDTEYTGEELVLIHISLAVNEAGQQTQYLVGELSTVLSIMDKLKELEKEVEVNGKKDLGYKDGAIDFSTDEKAFLKKQLNRKWNIVQGRVYIELEKKLS